MAAMLAVAALLATSTNVVAQPPSDGFLSETTQWAPDEATVRQLIGAPGAKNYAVGGRGFNDTGDYWTRLPASAKCAAGGDGCVRDIVWKLSLDSSGMFIQFRTDATAVGLAYTLRTDGAQANAPGAKLTAWTDFRQTGYSGADLYAWSETAKGWGFLGTTMGGLKYPNSSVLVSGIPAPDQGKLRTFRAHLPMYNAITDVSVLASGGKTIEPDWSFRDGGKPIVWYGTSITQGGVSPRPGHAYTNRIARAINREVLNLGFCGSGTMELSVAKHIAKIDTALFIIDCDWNMGGAEIAARAVPLAQYLRQNGHPKTPIVFAEGSDWPAHWISNASIGQGVAAKRAALESAVANLTSGGDNNVHLVQGHELYGDDAAAQAATYNNVHPTDLGHWRIAEFYSKFLPPLLLAGQQGQQQQPRAQRPPLPSPGARSAVQCTPPAKPCTDHPQRCCAPDISPGMTWTNFTALGIAGRAFNDTPTPFNRLPAAAQKTVRGPVWSLGLDAAGLSVRFESNAPTIAIQYTLGSAAGVGMPHFPASGVSGADLYALDEGVSPSVWKYVGTRQNLQSGTAQSGTVATDLPTDKLTSYRLYLPTYNTVLGGAIGVPSGAKLSADSRPGFKSPAVVWYGTSILQGGVASRVGNAFTNMISRRLQQEIYNFGFSGNGKMELGVYQHLAKLDASLIIIDCNWNMNGPSITANALPMLAYFRKNGHPKTPIVFAEGTPAGGEWLLPATRAGMAAKRNALRAAFETASPSDPNLHYVNASSFWPEQWLESPTVAGCHPTDEGGELITEFYTKMIPKWIATAGP